MTATREISTSRPSTHHRTSTGGIASSLPARHSRQNSTLSVGSLNPAHRVSRRKSVSTTAATNAAAVAAAVGGDAAQSTSRRTSKSFTPRGPPGLSSYPSMGSSLPNSGSGFAPSSYGAKNGSVVTDGPPLASIPDAEKANGKSRVRRASEGSGAKGKRAISSELRCEKCGKGYKHSSCLTKHLWEHTPEWAITSKLLISKHQQVQLLEAASVLVNMNQEAAQAESDHSSASPAASGSSDYRDDDDEEDDDDEMSSAETTPPPEAAIGSFQGPAARYVNKRFSSNSSAYSQSYQSNTSVFSESVPNSYGYYRHQSTEGLRPPTSGTTATAYDEEDQADLAAAVGLLSCSYGTPQSKPVMLPPDVPPVPPLPARFLSQNSLDSRTSSIATPPGQQQYATSLRSSYSSRSRHNSADDDVDMEDDEDDFERHQRSRGRSDEDEEGMFGRMEE